MISIRIMQHQDVKFGMELCELANWNQTESDWHRLLKLSPDGLFVAEIEGNKCGTASAVNYDNKIAWIGMVLVHPEYRRRGIGSLLLSQCIEYLKNKGVETVKLDATNLGRPMYLEYGFQDEYKICRYSSFKPCKSGTVRNVKRITDKDWPSIALLDDKGFGADRIRLLKLLAGNGLSAVVEISEKTQAYGFARKGTCAWFIGPVVANSFAAAESAVDAILTQIPDGTVYWDIFPDNTTAKELAACLGFSVVRELTRMYLGKEMNPGCINMIYGSSGFEFG